MSITTTTAQNAHGSADPMTSSSSSEEPADIPVIDFDVLIHGGPAEREATLKQMDESFQSYGFIYLANHSIPQETVDEAFKWVRESLGRLARLCAV